MLWRSGTFGRLTSDAAAEAAEARSGSAVMTAPLGSWDRAHRGSRRRADPPPYKNSVHRGRERADGRDAERRARGGQTDSVNWFLEGTVRDKNYINDM